MTKIKICGLTQMEDIAAVNDWHPDYIGFVFAKSKRQIRKEQAEKLKQQLCTDIQAVGVFVDASVDEAAQLWMKGVIDIIQLHGHESEDDIRELKKLTEGRARIIKALSMDHPKEVDNWQNSLADYLLLDNGRGGTGKTFDHHLVSSCSVKKPFFLAGGIDKTNVIQAIQMTHPFAVDISSGAETNGRKDAKKIEELVKMVRKESLR